MPWEATRAVPYLPTQSRPVYGEARDGGSCSHVAWGSGSYHDQVTGNLLDSAAPSFGEKSDEEVQRLQTVSSGSTGQPSTGKISIR